LNNYSKLKYLDASCNQIEDFSGINEIWRKLEYANISLNPYAHVNAPKTLDFPKEYFDYKGIVGFFVYPSFYQNHAIIPDLFLHKIHISKDLDQERLRKCTYLDYKKYEPFWRRAKEFSLEMIKIWEEITNPIWFNKLEPRFFFNYHARDISCVRKSVSDLMPDFSPDISKRDMNKCKELFTEEDLSPSEKSYLPGGDYFWKSKKKYNPLF
jgi:hypothetical protein